MVSITVFQFFSFCSTATIFLLFLNVKTCIGQAQRVQYIQLFNVSQTCTSIPMANLTLDSTLRFSNVTSLRVNGMWGVIAKVNGSLDFNKVVHINNDGACIPIQTSNITFVDRYGDLDLAIAQISLFVSPNYADKPWIADPLKGFNPPLMNVRSWAFSGNHSWSLYEGANFSGRRTCLQPSSQVRARGYGFTDAADSNLIVRSVMYGCTSGGADQPNAVAFLSALAIGLATIFKNY